jgi:hypothetical protein
MTTGPGGFVAELQTTGIGSLPFEDPQEAASFVLKAELSIPFWPQLPQRNSRELMIPQYSEGFPCVRIDESQKKIFCDTSDKADELGAFYEKFLAEDAGSFPITRNYAAGLFAFEEAAAGRTWANAKVQTTGPFTFTQGIQDLDGNPVYNDPDLRDAAVKLLVRKTQWQLQRFAVFSNGPLIVFLDEPVLSAYGSSAFVGVSESDVHGILREPLEAIGEAGAVSAIHVCGNSDWGVVIRSGIEILNFDAYEYGYSISLYADNVRELLARGGNIAWGIVPTSEAVRGESADSLAKRLADSFKLLKQKGFSESLLEERCLLTPSCGAGSLDVDDTRRVFDLLHELREKLTS